MKFLDKLLGLFILFTIGLTSCKEEVEIKNSLSVSPNTALEFNATGNESVTLTVETDADKWSYTAPEWVITEQKGNTLLVNVQDNSSASREGNIDFSAGTADAVKVNVIQNGSDGMENGKIVGSIKDESGKNNVNLVLDVPTEKTTLKLKLSFAEKLKSDSRVSVFMDKEYLEEYNYEHGTSCVIIPDNTLNTVEWFIDIPSGNSEAELSIDVNTENLGATKHLLPLKVKVVNGDLSFPNKESRVNYVISKGTLKEIKQMCVMEINDVNPLSVLEYKLEDGSYFFDAVVLFSGNMAWDENSQSVRFNASTDVPVINGNIDALVNEWKTYLKPIHDAGIKVYMGILPHHTPAGITTLSYYGCKMFGEEMAQIIHDCQMDGVFLDEEYVQGVGDNEEWFGNRAGGDYFSYQMSKQMDLVCDWETDVAVYTFGIGVSGWGNVEDHEDGSIHTPVEYADIIVANYGEQAFPLEGQTLKNCTGASFELNKSFADPITESEARQIKEDGYGWMMYFAFNPDPEHSLYNKPKALEYFKAVSRGCYDKELVEPTHYYKKKGEGEYDSTRYPY